MLEKEALDRSESDIYAKRDAEERRDRIDRYGQRLGETCHNYIKDSFKYPIDQRTNREQFAQAVVDVIRIRTYDEAIKGISALLEAVEERDQFIRGEIL